jgi:hypothetical protein
LGRIVKNGSGRINPSKNASGRIVVMLVPLFLLMLATVYLNVIRVKYGKEIQKLRREASTLSSEVRDLHGQKLQMTTLANIMQVAESMGMDYPLETPATLVVKVPKGERPNVVGASNPSWIDPNSGPSSSRELALLSRNRSSAQ